ncbi:MAG TPA: hypothetical protein ENI07_18320 [Desulfobacterales bacterium]|nr:hypothetical protein [Desulfobacterales bacterium]
MSKNRMVSKINKPPYRVKSKCRWNEFNSKMKVFISKVNEGLTNTTMCH